jgi:hypothetical protein
LLCRNFAVFTKKVGNFEFYNIFHEIVECNFESNFTWKLKIPKNAIFGTDSN